MTVAVSGEAQLGQAERVEGACGLDDGQCRVTVPSGVQAFGDVPPVPRRVRESSTPEEASRLATAKACKLCSAWGLKEAAVVIESPYAEAVTSALTWAGQGFNDRDCSSS